MGTRGMQNATGTRAGPTGLEMAATFFVKLGQLFYIVDPRVTFVSGDPISDPSVVPGFISEAIPFFFLLCMLEYVALAWQSSGKDNAFKRTYRLKDFIMSINLGTTQQIVGIWLKFFTMTAYCVVFEQFRAFRPWGDIPFDSMATYIAIFLGADCGYYWFHRTAHCWHFAWASHYVHHSGEDYNFATALRQGTFQSVSSWVFYLPLAAAGFPPAPFFAHSQLNTLYQFWIHTEAIDRCPAWFEAVMNTPCHHRMHHRPPGNCNYAGVLIIWDRMFGTFKAEDKIIDCYGLADQLTLHDPVFANFEHWRRCFDKIGGASPLAIPFKRRVKHAWVFEPSALLKAISYPDSPYSVSGPYSKPRVKYQGPDTPISTMVHVAIQFGFGLLSTLVVLLMGSQLAATPVIPVASSAFTINQQHVLAVIMLWMMSNIGRLCDGTGQTAESLRCAFLGASSIYMATKDGCNGVVAKIPGNEYEVVHGLTIFQVYSLLTCLTWLVACCVGSSKSSPSSQSQVAANDVTEKAVQVTQPVSAEGALRRSGRSSTSTKRR